MEVQKNDLIKSAVITIIGISLVSYYLWPHNPKNAAMQQHQPGSAVSVMQLQKEIIDLEEELPGRLSPFQIAEIRPQITGIITDRLFEEGALVQQGDQLYQIDASAYEAAYKLANAQLVKAQANLQSVEAKAGRYTQLVKTEAVSKQDHDDVAALFAQAKAEVVIAKANLDTAKINVDYTRVYAPITGYISKSEATKGALVTQNQPDAITRITQLSPIYLDITQPSSYTQRIRSAIFYGKPIYVQLFLDGEKEPYAEKGLLQFMDVTIEKSTDSVGLRAIFSNAKSELLPGQFVKARITLKNTDAILIPQKAVIFMPDGSASVWVVDNQYKVSLKTVVIERAIQDKWMITDGVVEGEMIVTEGFQRLKPGALVYPTPA